MNILLLLDKYIPFPQANGLCAKHILREIPNVHINVICKVDDFKKVTSIEESDVSIYPIYAPSEVGFGQLDVIGKLQYVCKHLYKSLIGPVFDKKIATAYYEQSCRIIDKNKPDMIMAVLNPMESVEALHRLKSKYPDIKLIIYDLDTASKSGQGKIEEYMKGVYQKRILSWEQKVFGTADLVIHLSHFRQHFSQKVYAEFAEKTLYQDVPLLEPKDDEVGHINKLSFIYSGSFYPRLREPNLITDIMDSVLEKSQSTFSVYTKGVAYKKLKEIYKGQDRVYISEYIPEKELDVVIAQTEFLLSLGNKESEMFPSKIVAYVSALKPIIHIYQSDSDPVNDYLRDYPDKLLLNVKDGSKYNAERILEFIRLDHTKIKRNLVETLYYRNSGVYNAEMILNYFFK